MELSVKTTLEGVCARALSVECGIRPGMRVLAAVSGGADSVALLLMMQSVSERLGFSLCAAHFNHHLRGESADGDAQFVKALCERLQIECRMGEGDVRSLAKTRGLGIEEAARSARYAFLQQAADEMGADAIALAHHADDQAETVLLHMARGCDIRGLCAMRARSGNLIRPLLTVGKSMLEDYLALCAQPFRVDESNLSDEADRNKIRHGAMQTLSRLNPRICDALCRLAQSAQRDEDYFAAQLETIHHSEFHAMPYGGFFATARLRGLPDALRSRALLQALTAAGIQMISSADIEKADALLTGSMAKTQLSGGVRLERARTRMHVLFPHQSAAEEAASVPVFLRGKTVLKGWTLEAREAADDETGDGVLTQALDADAVQGATLRTMRRGDVFAPLGMEGTQPLKKALADAGIERALRPYVPVLAKEERVLWIIGLRPARDAALTPQTARAILFTFKGDLPFLS